MVNQEELFQELVQEIEHHIQEQIAAFGSALPASVIIHDKIQQNWYSINDRPGMIKRLREHFGVPASESIDGYTNLPRL